MPSAQGGPRHGTILIAMFIFLIILFLVGGWFASYMVSLRGQSQRRGEVRLRTATAEALATAMFHVLQFVHLGSAPPDPALKNALSLPLSSFRGWGPAPLPIPRPGDPLSNVVTALLEALRMEDAGCKVEMTAEIRRDDFTPLGPAALAEEKQGYLRLTILLSMKGVVEEFHFAAPIRVTAAWLPILSKFTLFIDDPETSEQAPWRFNVVTTDPNGEIVPTAPKAVPIVLRNGDELAAGDLTNLDTFFQKRVGLIYFGGGPTVLNLARGESRQGTYGEAFHCFEVKNSGGEWDGLYTITEQPLPDGSGMAAVLQWDKGIADEKAVGEPSDWYDFVAGTPEAPHLKRNSAFRLFGVDQGRPSPTLVLGKVFRGQISARGYQTEPMGLITEAFFFYPRTMEQWEDLLTPDPRVAAMQGLECIATFATEVLRLTQSKEHRDLYRRLYASRGGQMGYNASLGFIATNNSVAHPFGNFRTTLREMMQAKKSIPAMSEVPAPLRSLLPGNPQQMPTLSTILTNSGLPAPRASWALNAASLTARLGLAEPPTNVWWHGLARLGMFDPATSKLTLRGWVILSGQNCDRDLIIDQPLSVSGNGGILLEKGNIIIQAPIDGGTSGAAEEGPPNVLQLACPKGNIVVSNLDGRNVDATLVAGKSVITKGGRPRLQGSLVTGTFPLSNASDGLDLRYNPRLAALPGKVSAEPLLCFTLAPTPLLIR